MTDKDMIEALGEALERKNAKIREQAHDLGKMREECRELRRKLVLAESESLYLKRKLEALQYGRC